MTRTSLRLFKELCSWIEVGFAAFHGLNDREVAEKVGVSRCTINRLRKGNFSPAIRFGTVQMFLAAAKISLTIDAHSIKASPLERSKVKRNPMTWSGSIASHP